MTPTEHDALLQKITQIDSWLEREASDRLAPQLHLDRATSECAYWHLGYAQAMADLLHRFTISACRESIGDTATSC